MAFINPCVLAADSGGADDDRQGNEALAVAAEMEQEMSQSDRWQQANSRATELPAETVSRAQCKL